MRMRIVLISGLIATSALVAVAEEGKRAPVPLPEPVPETVQQKRDRLRRASLDRALA